MLRVNELFTRSTQIFYTEPPAFLWGAASGGGGRVRACWAIVLVFRRRWIDALMNKRWYFVWFGLIELLVVVTSAQQRQRRRWRRRQRAVAALTAASAAAACTSSVRGRAPVSSSWLFERWPVAGCSPQTNRCNHVRCPSLPSSASSAYSNSEWSYFNAQSLGGANR